jgi:hypothetical protein
MDKSFLEKNKYLKYILNKYTIVILAFVFLLLLAPNNSVIYYFKVKKQYKEVLQQKQFVLDEITQDSIRNADLERNIKAKEKYGREKYIMKTPREDIYVIKHQEHHTLQGE